MDEWNTNIDLLFRNGLKDYEVLPPSDIWDNVRQSLPVRKGRLYPLLLRAAMFALLIGSAGTLVYLTRYSLTETIGNAPALTFNQDAIPSGSYKPSNSVRNFVLTPVIYTAQSYLEDNKDTIKQSPIKTADIPEAAILKMPENNIAGQTGTELRFAVAKFNAPPEKIIIEPSKITGENDIKENNGNEKWKLGATLLPSYYSRFDFGKNDATKDYINNERTAFAYSGGFSFSFDLSKRFTIESGMVYSSIGQRIDGVTSFSGFMKYTDTKSSSDFGIITSSGIITSTNKDIYFVDNGNVSRVLTIYSADVFDPYKANLNYLNSSLIQSLGYIEFPLILKYKLVDRKVDINMLGGLSYGILFGNSSYINSGGTKYIIGKTEGVSPVTFSSSLGMGMEYKISGHFTFNLEPVFRYYLTPLGGITGSLIHPYSLGILSGVFYSF